MIEQLIGQSLNERYQIISLLGQGGMGSVLKGHDNVLQRDVAIKVMHPHYARQSDLQQRFLQEARTAARLSHPGIVQVFDYDETPILYIVMEFIPGDNLRQMLKKLKANNQWLFLSDTVKLIQQVCLSLDYAHRQKVLHRDIKPENIMLKLEPSQAEPSDDSPLQPVITDLGLAKLLEGGLETKTGVSVGGTVAYMSPE